MNGLFQRTLTLVFGYSHLIIVVYEVIKRNNKIKSNNGNLLQI